MEKNKKENYKMNNLASFTIVIMVMFMTIISIEVITVTYTNKSTEDVISNFKTNNKITTTKKYDTSNMTFQDIYLTNEEFNISSRCESGCNIAFNMYGIIYKYIIKFNTRTYEYTLDIVKEDKAIIVDRSLGYDIENLSLKNYTNNIVLKNIINDKNFIYDYILFLNQDDNIDEFTSLDSNEIEFTENGVIYYYDVCEKSDEGNAKKVKAIRIPYINAPAIISSEVKNYEWCN